MIEMDGVITYHDGRSEEVHVRQGDIVAWEMWALRNGLPPQLGSQNPIGGTQLRFYAYAAGHRGIVQSEWQPSFEEWTATVAAVDYNEEQTAELAAAVRAREAALNGENAEETRVMAQVFPPERSAG